MKSYVSIKTVKATPCSNIEFCLEYPNRGIDNTVLREGYKIQYPDGYISWSPDAPFVEASMVMEDSTEATHQIEAYRALCAKLIKYITELPDNGVSNAVICADILESAGVLSELLSNLSDDIIATA